MNEEINTIIPTEIPANVPIEPAMITPTPKLRENRGGDRGKRPSRRPSRRDTRTKPEFEQKIVSLRRVTRVMAGGRRFSFSVCLVAGNRKGSVGVGQGKASDTPLAIEKAFRDAKKNMITVNATKKMSIPHDIEAKYAASRVKIMPARGKGILAGSSVRTVLELAGLREIGAKLLSRSKNSANNAYVAIKALKQLETTKIRNKS
ncbi:MAG: 30S ribosomal protein S5 [bacterium]|nr:30S ribosomal protein S5 [bacterium]MDZ4205793.1 30S ribosomal protein S5 [Patescibacteria group bacterium]